MLARSVTECNKACGKRVPRLISYIKQNKNSTDNTALSETTCGIANLLGVLKKASFGRDLQDSKSTSGGAMCAFDHTDIGPNSLDVQEANSRVSQQCRNRKNSLDAGF